MSRREVDALLERLVAQFESPYDFLRELVQNAIDAGSDRVEIALEAHAREDGSCVYELVVSDTGRGMDEATIDDELTRLFGTSKSGDASKAGGFGIGFVSVFAWKPDVILLQTGRLDEGWELEFAADRTFTKARIDTPIEGTTIRLFRRGPASDRPRIAEAIRDTLWRWARYCPLEVTFEDVGAGELELIHDEPAPDEAVVSRTLVSGDTRIVVGFGVPASAVLLRRGLVLAEGTPRTLLPKLAESGARTLEHLQVWADSPLLRTTMARDKVVDDEGLVTIQKRVMTALDELRVDLFERVEALTSSPDPWDRAVYGRWTVLLGHLLMETERASGQHVDELKRRPVLRDARTHVAWSPGRLGAALKGRPLVVTMAPIRGEQRERDLLSALDEGDLPILIGDPASDRGLFSTFAGLLGVDLVDLEAGGSRVVPIADEASGLLAMVVRLLGDAGMTCQLSLGRFVDGDRSAPPLVGVEIARRGHPLVLHGGGSLGALLGREVRLWLDRDHVLVEKAIQTASIDARVTAVSLAVAILGRLGDRAPDVDALARAHERVT